ncbi:peptide chain release factor N(5)-glutamine methyltransferase [Geofilum rubicundum]|uniref:peptide chain release factor N(5)-glutamine methyltransferase n=1 Tax=Geofilum rubicundum JCM 15548 TaxID=1236989 RepID=A0A0E9M1J1_9BACT|nr:peptide chain release factor N(5)-glutamine methyltransferase [Geofilum rubicundum]GAO31672.1 methylase of polypeptide chain release factors [Geofilum rubicundum JCM 15548]
MSHKQLFLELQMELATQIRFLADKPEETVESTLKALWNMAAGHPVSAVKAMQTELPLLTEEQVQLLQQLIQRRISNTPLAYISGRQSFMGIEMLVDKRALIPRKETELLGLKALELSQQSAANKKPVIILDVCCGAGNLGIALAAYNPHCQVYSTDLSNEATELTLENIQLLKLSHRIEVRQGDLFSAFESKNFYNKSNLIVCNPPYITSSRVDKMTEEIAGNEPPLAFDGGMLGISIIQKLLRESPKFLAPEGWLAFEVGAGQGNFVLQLLKKSEVYTALESLCDHSGTIRVIVAQNKA